MSTLSDRLAALTPEQRAYLLSRLKQQDVEAPTGGLIPIHSREANAFPVSPAQRTLWIFEQLEPGNAAYNLSVVIHLTGQLNVELFEESINAVIARHESLRTTFAVDEGGQPVQTIAPALSLPLPFHYQPWFIESEREAELITLAESEAAKPFDLENGPLLRQLLIRKNQLEHNWLLTLHHLVSDFWSFVILLKETFEIYGAKCSKREGLLPLPAFQYADYTEWQRAQLQGAAFERQMAYWKEKLHGPLKVLELPLDFPRPPVQTFRGAHYQFHLPQRLLDALRQLSSEEEATLFMTLMAAFQTLLYRYSGHDDLIVGFNASDRSTPGAEGVTGHFVNTLPLRSDLSGNPRFRDLLGQVRKFCYEALTHRQVPFEMLVDAVHNERNPSYPPLLQVLFNLNRIPSDFAAEGLTSTWRLVDGKTSKFDLSLEAFVGEQSGFCIFEFNTDLFLEERIGRMAGHFITLLEGIASNRDRTLNELPLLTETERRLMLEEWNETAREVPHDRTLPQLFEEQARCRPDHIALICDGQQISYRELNERANRLAHYLIKQGVGPEVIVGIYMERSIDFIVSLLGIFKAGGAYVPLDPSFPGERISYMLESSGIGALIASHSYAEILSSYKGASIVLDRDQQRIAQESVENLPSEINGDNLAYVIYTSGSTGKPKGAMIEQRGMVNHLFAKVIDLELTQDDRVSQNASQSFDISVWQYFASLVAGGSVCIYRNEVAHDPLALLNRVVKDKVTVLEVVPSMLRVMLQEVEAFAVKPDLSSLRWLILTGEALPPELARKWLNAYPEIPLLNAYGPTECSDDVTHHAIFVPPGNEVANLPIGRPVVNMRMYVLNDAMEPCPIGVPGQLYVGGIGVGRGYLGDPQRNKASFVTDPFASEEGRRLYRTGDLGRYSSDGAIVYLGRIDHQVKIRGFRIELGEIESVIVQYDPVEAAVVIAHEDLLVAYLLMRPECKLAASELHAHAARALPEYMIPSFFVVLDAFPLTATGKIDRRALPVPDIARHAAGDQPERPLTETERELAGIWSEVLEVYEPGANDHFFQLGGHSLLATRVVSRMRAKFAIDFPLRILFENPTLSALAYRVEEMLGTSVQGQPASGSGQGDGTGRGDGIAKARKQDYYELSHAQMRLWFSYKTVSGNDFGMLLPYELNGPLQLDAFRQAIAQLVERHSILRTLIIEINGAPFQTVRDDLPLQIAYEDLSELQDEAKRTSLRARLLREQHTPFDMEAEAGFRVHLYKLGPDKHLLLFNAHHLVGDAWTTQLLLQDLALLYEASSTDAAVKGLPPVLQYVDFASWQNRCLQDGTFDSQRRYWVERLSDRAAPPSIPYDFEERPAGLEPDITSGEARLWIEAELAGALNELAGKAEATLYLILVSALQIGLAKASGQDVVTIGCTLSGRTRPELERVAGLFINPAAMRTDLSGNPTCLEAIERVKQMALDAYSNQDYPFDLILQDIRQQTGHSHKLYSVVFIGQNVQTSEFGLAGITASYCPPDEMLQTEEEQTGPAADPLLPEEKDQPDLLMTMKETNGGIEISTVYNTRHYLHSTIEQFHDQLIDLLRRIAAEPNIRLKQLQLQERDESEELNNLFG